MEGIRALGGKLGEEYRPCLFSLNSFWLFLLKLYIHGGIKVSRQRQMTAFSMPPFASGWTNLLKKTPSPSIPVYECFRWLLKRKKTHIVLHVCTIVGKKVVASRLRPFKKSIRQMETNGKNGIGLFVCCPPSQPRAQRGLSVAHNERIKWNHNQASFFCAVLLNENNSVTGEPNKRWKGRLASKNTAKWPNWYCGFLGISIQIRFLNFLAPSPIYPYLPQNPQKM